MSPITTPASELSPRDVAEHRFSTSFRGLDPAEVRDFLSRLSGQLAEMQRREGLLRRQLDQIEEEAARPQLRVIPGGAGVANRSESTESSEQIGDPAVVLADAEREAAAVMARAHDEAAKIILRARAEGRGRNAEGGSSELAASTREAPVDLDEVRQQAREIVAEAKAFREKVLGDLAKRRRIAHVQLEHLRAAKEKLLDALRDARKSVEDTSRELSTLDIEVKVAADLAAKRAEAEPFPTVEALEVELATARQFGVPIIASRAGLIPVIGERGAGGPAVPSAPQAGAQPEAQPAPGGADVPDQRDNPGARDAEVTHRVGGLFARLRAEQSGPVAGSPPPSIVQEISAESIPAQIAESHSEVGADRPTTDHAMTASLPPAGGAAAVRDEPWRTRRSEMVQSLEPHLARALKRALQDDQSAALERIRKARGRLTLSSLWPEEAEHIAALAGAVEMGLTAAAAATGLADEDRALALGRKGAVRLADAVVSALRHAVAPVVGDGLSAEADGSTVVDAASSAYRGWRSEPIVALVSLTLKQVFAAAVAGGLHTGQPVRWVTGKPGCPACDANAAAGVLAYGAEFPSGHTVPPLHDGCLCMVAPASAP